MAEAASEGEARAARLAFRRERARQRAELFGGPSYGRRQERARFRAGIRAFIGDAPAVDATALPHEELGRLFASDSSSQDSAYALWSSTASGRAYQEWEARAQAYIAFVDDREREWQDTWRALIGPAEASGEFVSVPPQRRPGPLLPASAREQWSALLLVLGGCAVALAAGGAALVGLAAVLGVLRDGWSEGWPSRGPSPEQWTTGSWMLGVGVALLAAYAIVHDDAHAQAERRARRAYDAARAEAVERNCRLIAAARRRRIRSFGFDPLAYPEQVPSWSPQALRVAERLDEIIATARTALPPVSSLPVPPPVVFAEPMGMRPLALAALLRAWHELRRGALEQRDPDDTDDLDSGADVMPAASAERVPEPSADSEEGVPLGEGLLSAHSAERMRALLLAHDAAASAASAASSASSADGTEPRIPR